MPGTNRREAPLTHTCLQVDLAWKGTSTPSAGVPAPCSLDAPAPRAGEELLRANARSNCPPAVPWPRDRGSTASAQFVLAAPVTDSVTSGVRFERTPRN